MTQFKLNEQLDKLWEQVAKCTADCVAITRECIMFGLDKTLRILSRGCLLCSININYQKSTGTEQTSAKQLGFSKLKI